MPSGLEVFADVASCVVATNGYNGGASSAGAPSAGTTESWTMAAGYTTFPVASTSAVPNTYFYIRDPADTSNEIVLVTSGGSSGTGWSVTRGANGVTSTHAAGATWDQVTAALTFANFRQASGAGTSAVTVGGTTNEIILANYTPTAAELETGTVFEAVAFGPITTPHTAAATLQFSLYWGGSGSVGGTYTTTGGVLLARILTNQNSPALPSTVAAGSSFDINGEIVWLSSTQAHANLNAWYTNATSLVTTAANATTSNTSSSNGQSQAGPVTISGSGPIVLTAKWSSATPSLTAVAPLIRRAA